MNFGKEMCNVWPLSKHAQHLQKFVMFYLANLVIWQLQNYLPSKKQFLFNNLLFQTWRNEKKGNRQHASREKTLFSWSVRSMQAGRRFTKLFAKLPNIRGEGGFLPSCYILLSRLPNCWRSILSVFSKN